jgi:hypothetical protein
MNEPIPFATIAPMLCPHCGADCEPRRTSYEVTHIDEFRTEHTVTDTRHVCPEHGDVTDALVDAFVAGFTRFFGY